MIIGGANSLSSSSMKTEILELDNEVHNIIQPDLPNDFYGWGMAVFEVNANFCKKVPGMFINSIKNKMNNLNRSMNFGP